MESFEPDLYMIRFLFSNGVFYQPPLVTEREIIDIGIKFKKRTGNKYITEWGTYMVNGDEITFEGWCDDPCNTTYTQHSKILNDTTFLIYDFEYSGKKTPKNQIFNYRSKSLQMDSINPKIKPQ